MLGLICYAYSIHSHCSGALVHLLWSVTASLQSCCNRFANTLPSPASLQSAKLQLAASSRRLVASSHCSFCQIQLVAKFSCCVADARSAWWLPSSLDTKPASPPSKHLLSLFQRQSASRAQPLGLRGRRQKTALWQSTQSLFNVNRLLCLCLC